MLQNLIAVILAASCGAATAQADQTGSAQHESGQGANPVFRSSKIIGAQVRDLEGRRVGDIHELILGPGRSEIAYALVSFGGVLGVGMTFHAVPWSSLEPRAGGLYYVFRGERAALKDAPGFDLARWPDLEQQAWREQVDRYWEARAGTGSGRSESRSGW